jgi:hypothetical protein
MKNCNRESCVAYFVFFIIVIALVALGFYLGYRKFGDIN